MIECYLMWIFRKIFPFFIIDILVLTPISLICSKLLRSWESKHYEHFHICVCVSWILSYRVLNIHRWPFPHPYTCITSTTHSGLTIFKSKYYYAITISISVCVSYNKVSINRKKPLITVTEQINFSSVMYCFIQISDQEIQIFALVIQQIDTWICTQI